MPMLCAYSQAKHVSSLADSNNDDSGRCHPSGPSLSAIVDEPDAESLLRAHIPRRSRRHTVREAEGDIYRPGVYLDSLQEMANLPCGTSCDACSAAGGV